MVEHKFIFPPKKSVNPIDYYYYPEGFSSEELEKVEELVKTLEDNKAIIQAGADESYRKSTIKWIPQNQDTYWLYDKLANLARIANNELWNFDLHTIPELIQYTEYYEDGGHYDWHMDVGPNETSHRKVSLTVQLSDSDEYEGGNFEMLTGRDIKTASRGKGAVVVFPSYILHRVTPITKGKRRSFVLWLGGGHYK